MMSEARTRLLWTIRGIWYGLILGLILGVCVGDWLSRWSQWKVFGSVWFFLLLFVGAIPEAIYHVAAEVRRFRQMAKSSGQHL